MRWFICLFVCCLSLVNGDEYVAKNYSLLTNRMPKVDVDLLKMHLVLYQGYVNQVNMLDTMLKQELRSPKGDKSFTYQALKRRFAWERNGMVLHEMYFDNIGGTGKLVPESGTHRAIVREFSSIDAWERDFKATCQVRGIGWAIVYYNLKTGRVHNAWVQEHDTGPLVGEVPLLVVDLWEHAYLTQFGLDRQSYIDTIIGYVDWAVVEERLKECRATSMIQQSPRVKPGRSGQLERE